MASFKLVHDLDTGTSSVNRNLGVLLAETLDSPGSRTVINNTWAETGEEKLSVVECVDGADMLRNQDQQSHKEIFNSTYKVLQLKEACCSETYARMCCLSSGGVSHISMPFLRSVLPKPTPCVCLG